MRITTVRIICQSVLFCVFLALSLLTTFAYLDSLPGLKLWLSKFLEIDPLIAISTAITTHTVYKGLLWSLVLLVPTLFLGRFFCDWMCPYGSLHHFVGWAFNRRNTKHRIESNRHRPLYRFKYYLLVALLAAAVLGSLQIGLLDPLCLLHRSVAVSVAPTWDMAVTAIERGLDVNLSTWRFRLDPGVYQLGWVIGAILFVLVALNVVIPRFFCRSLCPLGATLGFFSRFSLWRIDRDPDRCTHCDLCLRSCEAACDPQADLRKAECFVCFNCVEECPHDALRFAFVPAGRREISGTDVAGRRAVFAAVAGFLFYPFARASARTKRDFSSKAIRPPGAVEEQEFLERCVKCGQCMRVCPTNVLQPAVFEAGVEGLWTPVMNYRIGFCQTSCTACGHVCPTGAIQHLSVAQKLGAGPHEQAGPVRLGTAHFDRGRCLPWSKNIPCVVCEEVCPTSPKAIYSERMQLAIRDGAKQVVAAGDRAVTLAEQPRPGEFVAESARFEFNQFAGDQTTRYFVEILHADGVREVHPIASNDIDTLLIADRWHQTPAAGETAVIMIEFRVPKVDVSRCTGCGLCEHECPVVSDRRAVYVTAEGETRSQHYQEAGRNRSVRLLQSSGAS
ncbi:MAG TPA: 4Fe-4S dicluster domain-containing protein [Phycisphaerae bacterium]|nr:4Fe-4S dicluster domain-containing protein [Phycisphaerae bacterium]